MSLEMEHGKDFVTYFEDIKKVCFYAIKTKRKEFEIRKINDGQFRYFTTFFDDEEQIVDLYTNYRRNMTTNRVPIPYYCSSNSIVDEDGTDYSKELTKEQREAVKKRIQICKEKYRINHSAMCCPDCHKLHKIEKYFVVKDSAKDFMEKVQNQFGPDWYSILISEHNFDYYEIFESIYDKEDVKEKKCYSIDEINGYQNLYSIYQKINGQELRFYPKLVCPECGCLTNEYEYVSLSIFDKFSSNNSRLVATTIFNDKNKIAVSQLYNCYYINVDAQVISKEEFRTRLTFNTQTGQTYFIGPKRKNGKAFPGWHYFRLINVTYRYNPWAPHPVDIMYKDPRIKKEVFKLLMERNGDSIEKFKNFPIIKWRLSQKPISELDIDNIEFCDIEESLIEELLEIKSIDDINFSDIPFSWITMYNRFPCLNGIQLENLYPENYQKGYQSNYYMRYIFKGVKRNFSAQELLNTVCKNLKLTASKKAKKIITKDLLLTKELYVFSRLGFRDVNIIYSFVELFKDSNQVFSQAIYYEDLKDVSIFVKDMIKKKGEPKTFKTLFADNVRCNYVVDSARMYVKFKQENMVLNEYFTDSIKKIHDRMSRDYDKIRFKNEKINYPKKANKLNITLESGYEFALAEDTNELVRIGQELKICVGGYRDYALSNSCFIVSMKENGKYVGCIELDRDCATLLQAKAIYNNLLQEHKAEALKEWIETLSINAKNCGDYHHIKTGNIEYDVKKLYLSDHDYHAYELDEEGNVVDRHHHNYDDYDDDDYLPFY